MAKNRRLAAAAGAITLASVFTAGPVSAQSTAEVYLGSASGRALNVQLLGVGATLGVSSSKVTSQLTAVAEGAGQLLNSGTTAKVDLSGNGTSETKPDACAVALPVADILNVGLACGSASGSIAGNNPVANSEGRLAGVTLDVENILGLAGLNNTVTGLTSSTLGTVKTTVTGLPVVGPILGDVVATVDSTVTDLLNTRTLEVTAGKSTSSVVTDAGKVTSLATASGAEIKILPIRLPVAGVDVGPLATITVGSASAKAVYDRATGTSTPSFDPSLVTIKLGATALLGAQEIKVPVGVSQTILAGTPLESDIIVAAGRNVTNPDGTVGAIADGVKLHLLKGVNNGILIELAHAEAGVGGTPAAAAPAAAPNVELPRTGGTPWIPLAGVSILGLAVLVRRVLVRAY
ncbi:MAG TPA: LPXTG cell wall anchor domain-containing protein [Acidimicrobiales bacterium]|nr:LPXTG cell wall anchor domain-containing protein [Acidimicrobiales bacterium]